MTKKVLLLAVSCKNGGLCPGGIDLDNPREWIRIVKNDGRSGAVQGRDIDFASPLDVIEFDGTHKPQGKQRENWIINNNSCKVIGRRGNNAVTDAYKKYGYHGFWDNYRAFLTKDEFEDLDRPSESILKVSNVEIYKTEYDKAKIDFDWSGSRYRIRWISMTDQTFYDQIDDKSVILDNAYIVISIPKEIEDWVHPETGEKRAYKFVSKVFEISTPKGSSSRNKDRDWDDDYYDDVYKALVEWRLKKSRKLGLPAYCVLKNDTIKELAMQLPKTRKDLRGINGIGPSKIETYGEEIIDIITSVTND